MVWKVKFFFVILNEALIVGESRDFIFRTLYSYLVSPLAYQVFFF